MAQPISLIIFYTTHSIIVVGFAFVRHSSYVRGRAWQVQEASHRERKDQRAGMGGHMEGTSSTEHTEVEVPVDPEKKRCGCHFKPELYFITYKQSALVLTSLSLRFKCMCPSMVSYLCNCVYS